VIPALPAPRLAVMVWMLMFAAVAVGSLLPAPALPAPSFDGFDKVEHLLGYAALSGYAALLFATPHGRFRGMLLAIAFGVAIEFAQGWLTATREPDLFDVLANSIGAAIGQLIGFTRYAGRLRAHA
jgi:VanZ family protein